MGAIERLRALGRFAERLLDRLDPVLEVITGNLWVEKFAAGREEKPRLRRRVHVDADGNVTRVETLDPSGAVVRAEDGSQRG